MPYPNITGKLVVEPGKLWRLLSCWTVVVSQRWPDQAERLSACANITGSTLPPEATAITASPDSVCG